MTQIIYTDREWAAVQALHGALERGLPTELHALMDLDGHARVLWDCIEQQGLREYIMDGGAEEYHDTEMSYINDLLQPGMDVILYNLPLLRHLLELAEDRGVAALYFNQTVEDAFTVYNVMTEQEARADLQDTLQAGGTAADWVQTLWEDSYYGKCLQEENEADGGDPLRSVPALTVQEMQEAVRLHELDQCKVIYNEYCFEILYRYLRRSKAWGGR